MIAFLGVALLGSGTLIGRASISASEPSSVYLIPYPSECEAGWRKDLKLAIESGTGAKVSFSRFSESVPQYPNLAGIVQIAGIDRVAPSDIRVYMNGALARCYAGASAAVPLNNPQFGRLLQLTITDLRKQTKLPIYLTLDEQQVIVHYNLPLF